MADANKGRNRKPATHEREPSEIRSKGIKEDFVRKEMDQKGFALEGRARLANQIPFHYYASGLRHFRNNALNITLV